MCARVEANLQETSHNQFSGWTSMAVDLYYVCNVLRLRQLQLSNQTESRRVVGRGTSLHFSNAFRLSVCARNSNWICRFACHGFHCVSVFKQTNKKRHSPTATAWVCECSDNTAMLLLIFRQFCHNFLFVFFCETFSSKSYYVLYALDDGRLPNPSKSTIYFTKTILITFGNARWFSSHYYVEHYSNSKVLMDVRFKFTPKPVWS